VSNTDFYRVSVEVEDVPAYSTSLFGAETEAEEVFSSVIHRAWKVSERHTSFNPTVRLYRNGDLVSEKSILDFRLTRDNLNS